jgi:hypothetical protein
LGLGIDFYYAANAVHFFLGILYVTEGGRRRRGRWEAGREKGEGRREGGRREKGERKENGK